MFQFRVALERPLGRRRFGDALRIAVQDQAAIGTINLLSRPEGRTPAEELVALSAWFNGLALQDRQNVERVIEMAAADATFGTLYVLDGVRSIEDRPDKGTLDLRYRRNSTDISLNDDLGAPLHELF